MYGRGQVLIRDRVRFSLKTGDKWNGLMLEVAPEAGTLAVGPVPQVGFRKSREEGFVFVSEEALSKGDVTLPASPYGEEDILVVADSDVTARQD